MTQDRSVDERISAWLLEEAPSQLPDRVLQATFERTRPSRQRRAFPGWRPFPMTRITPTAFAVGAAAILVLAVGVALLPRSNPSVGGGPSPSPTPSPTPSTTPSSTPAASPTPTLTPISLTGQIAFQRTVDGNTDIYMMNLDRTGLVRLTDDPAADTNPGWSPDGNRLVFKRGPALGGGDLFVMNVDGTGETPLTRTAGDEDYARFSPDGQTIAFWVGTEAASELRLIDPDGSNERLLVRFDDTFAAGISWTADGKAILFNRDLTSGGAIDIVRIELASQEITRITDHPGDDSDFAVSNDGLTIAFQSDRSPGGIFLMAIDGSNVRHLTASLDRGRPISWSPDGEHLVFVRSDGWLNLVGTDGSEPIRWTQGGPWVAWRPAS